MMQAESRRIKVTQMRMFTSQNKAKLNTQNMKGLELAAIKLTTLLVTKYQNEGV
jgi:hypothetical protein